MFQPVFHLVFALGNFKLNNILGQLVQNSQFELIVHRAHGWIDVRNYIDQDVCDMWIVDDAFASQEPYAEVERDKIFRQFSDKLVLAWGLALDEVTPYSQVELLEKPLRPAALRWAFQKLLLRLERRRLNKVALANQSLEARYKILSTVVEQSANAIAIFDSESKLSWVNQGFRDIYGLEDHELTLLYGKTITELSPHDKLDKHIEEIKTYGLPVHYDSQVRTGTLEYKWIHHTLSPIYDKAGEISQIISIGTDFTAQKRAEDELVIQRDDILNMTHELRSAMHDTQLKNEEIRRKNAEIRAEKQEIEEGQRRAEKLLMSVLPFEAAVQLKSKGSAQPRNYKMVSVLFADIVGFSKACINLKPQEVVNTVHAYFSIFDDIVENRHIEKIKTIGDAYMCAGGIPLRNKSNPVDVVLAALEMQHFLNNLYDVPGFQHIPHWQMRIGVHTGPVIAGVVGKRKIAYDIWGDTVNVASRMETAGESGKVNISGDTYELIKDYFMCTFRGKHEVKNRGNIDMYFVEGLRPEFAADLHGVKPNDYFNRFLYTL